MHANHDGDFRPLHYSTYALSEQVQPVQTLPSSLISGHYYGYFDMNCGYRTDEFGRSVSTQMMRNYRAPSASLSRPLGLDVDVSMLHNVATPPSAGTSTSVSNSPPEYGAFYNDLGKDQCYDGLGRRAPSPNLPWLSKKLSSGDARTNARYRIVYNEKQKMELEKEFRFHQYISTQRKKQLAEELNLSERQVKVWFQNRRSKDRKDRYQLAALKGCVANCLVDNLSVMRCPHCQECSANCSASKEASASLN